VFAILLAGRSAAGSPHDDYRRAYERGEALSKAQDWAAARVEFEIAWQLEQRPVVLFDIGSCFWHEGDRAKAITYYRRYLAVADDPELAEMARTRLADLEQVVAEGYPSAAIDRPATLPAHTLATGAGMALSPRYTPSMTGGVTTSYTPLALVVAGYGITDAIEVAGELDVGLHDAFGGVRGVLELARGTLTASIDGSVTTHDTGLYDVRAGIALRYKLAEHLALISDEDQLLVSFDTAPSHVLLPLGVAYQFGSRVYGWAETHLAIADRHAVSLLGADYRFAMVGATIVPRNDLDIVVTARAFDAGGDGSVFVRLRF